MRVFAPSIGELLAVGLPMLAGASLLKGHPDEVRCAGAFWMGWLGAVAWFAIVKAEYINPYKASVAFILLPGLLLGYSYFLYQKPHEVGDYETKIATSMEAGKDINSENIVALQKQENLKLMFLLRDSIWVWLTGSALAAFTFWKLLGESFKGLEYSMIDSRRSRALLGKAPGRVDPKKLPPKTAAKEEWEVSFLSDTPRQPRVHDKPQKWW